MARTVPPTGSLREAWALTRVIYQEFSFQSIYALKQGNVLDPSSSQEPLRAVRKARSRVAQSKLMVSLLLLFIIVAGAFALTRGGAFGIHLAPVDYATSVIAGQLLLLFSLLWMTGLQIAPTLSNSRIFNLIATLPVPERQNRRVATFLLLRVFDAPALTALLFLPLSDALATGSLPAAVALYTASFFVSQVSGSRGGTRGTSALRWIYLLLWSLPSLAITGFVSFSSQILNTLGLWEVNNPLAFQSILLVFPFPFGYLPAQDAFPGQDPFHLLDGLPFWLAVAAYAALGVLAARWLFTAPMTVSLRQPKSSRGETGTFPPLRRSSPTGAILQKDLRVASRTPGYAFLILLPLLDAFVLGLSSYVAAPGPAAAGHYALAAVTVAALLATFFGPAFFATEVLGYSFTRTLPISRRTLLLGKASLIVLIYTVASLLVMGLVAFRVGDPVPFLVFALAELPAVLGAAVLELGVLFNRAERTGIPLTNLYSGAWWTMLVVIPGLVVAGIPLVLYTVGQYYHTVWAVPSMALSALALLTVTGLWALWGRGRAA
jgi:predicted permease